LRSELEADVTRMMKVPRLQVISRIPAETIQTIRRTARGCGGVSESPPWNSNDATGTVGPARRGRSGHGVASHHGTDGLRGWGLSGRSNDVI
jgi:hypothetical protein